MRSRLTERSAHPDKLSIVRNSQSFERYVHPSNGSSRIDVVTREVGYKSSRRGSE